jgi:RNA polymerase sigma-70 factor (ECF subfamily)
MIASVPCPPTGSLPESPLVNPPDTSRTALDQRILQAQNGNLEAFNEIVLIYQDRIYRQALWILNDEDAAEDACQEAFLRAYRKIHTFNGPSVRNWLLQIVTNICLDQIRINKRRPCRPLEITDEFGDEIEPWWCIDPGETPDRACERNETGEEIIRAMQKLRPEYRTPLVLVDIQGLNYAEACAILHIPLGTLKSKVFRARVKLREELRGLCAAGRMDVFARVNPVRRLAGSNPPTRFQAVAQSA